MTSSPAPLETIIQRIRQHAAAQPTRPACTFLEFNDDQETATTLTTAELERRARQLALHLVQQAQAGDRALLMYPAGLDFIVAFLGCLYAGVVAVPVYPPRKNRSLDRLQSIFADADPRLILTTAAIEKDLHTSLAQDLAGRVTLATDAVNLSGDAPWTAPLPALDALAYLQYTSGSTGTPKGVMITHRNLAQNELEIRAGFHYGPESVMVSWLPMFHDMGLVGGVLQPIYTGFPTVLMAPVAFVQRPARWLKAFAKYGGTTGGGPNFGYEHCARLISDDEKRSLDLSRWTLAYNGSEPVRAATLERFAAAFKSCGFQREAFFPCFGLAEATLFVTGGPPRRAPVVLSVIGRAIERGRVSTAIGSDDEAKSFVGCGRAWLGTQVAIVDQETDVECPSDTIGKIWVRSDSIAAGYWQRPEESQATFGCRLPGVEGKFLDTGDLGFVRDGELFITGRSKDLIIIRGRNLYPQDIEATVERVVEFVQPNSCAAFSIDVAGDERLAIVAEANRALVRTLRDLEKGVAGNGEASAAAAEVEQLVAAIRSAITEDHEVQVHAVAFVRPGSFPTTSSGKVQRKACRAGLLHGKLEFIYRWGQVEERGQGSGARGQGAEVRGQRSEVSDAPRNTKHQTPNTSPTADEIIHWFRDYAERRLNSRVMDERRSLPPYVVLDFGNHGLFGLQVPREYGGCGLSHVDMLRVVEQLAAVDITPAFMVGIHNGLGVRPLLNFGPQALKDALLPTLAAGRQLASFALTEPGAGSNPKALRATATRDGAGWRIRGEKQWIGLASWAGLITVFAKAVEPDGTLAGTVALAVREDTPGVRQGPEALTMGVRGIVQNTIYFEDAWVGDECVIGRVGDGMAVAQEAMMFCRLGLGIMSIGGMKRAAQLMVRYASRRTVGTGSLIDNPVTLARLDELTVNIAAAEALLYHVAGMMDRGASVPVEAFAACKTSGPEMFFTAADQMMQMLGGRGYIETNLAPQMLRDARGLRIFEGPTETMHMYLGANVQQQPASIEKFLAEEFGCPDTARDLLAAAAAVREHAGRAGSPFPTGPQSLQWANYRVGELATAATLAAAVEHRRRREPTSDLQRASVAMRQRFTALRDATLAGLRSFAEPVSSPSLLAAVERYAGAIGDVQQHLAGEDHEFSGYLRRDGEPRREVSSGQKSEVGGQKSEVRSQRSDVGDQSPVAGDSTRVPGPWPLTPDPSLPASSLQPPASPPADTRAMIAELLVKLLREEMNLQVAKVGYDEPFTSFGLDSVGAEAMALELEKRLGRRLNTEVLYEFQTINALAAYLDKSGARPQAV